MKPDLSEIKIFEGTLLHIGKSPQKKRVIKKKLIAHYPRFSRIHTAGSQTFIGITRNFWVLVYETIPAQKRELKRQNGEVEYIPMPDKIEMLERIPSLPEENLTEIEVEKFEFAAHLDLNIIGKKKWKKILLKIHLDIDQDEVEKQISNIIAKHNNTREILSITTEIEDLRKEKKDTEKLESELFSMLDKLDEKEKRRFKENLDKFIEYRIRWDELGKNKEEFENLKQATIQKINMINEKVKGITESEIWKNLTTINRKP